MKKLVIQLIDACCAISQWKISGLYMQIPAPFVPTERMMDITIVFYPPDVPMEHF
jgi:hypothetical protein